MVVGSHPFFFSGTIVFGSIGALTLMGSVLWLLYVRRSTYEPKSAANMLPLAPYVQTAVAPECVWDLKRDIHIAYQRAIARAIMGMGTGIAVGAVAQFGLAVLAGQWNSKIPGTDPVASGLVNALAPTTISLVLGGQIVGVSIGAVAGLWLTPYDLRRTTSLARKLSDLASPLIALVLFALVIASLAFTFYTTTNAPSRSATTPLDRSFPWLPSIPAFVILTAAIIAQICATIICRANPRRWTSLDEVAEVADRSCRTTLIALVYAVTLCLVSYLIMQSFVLGYPHYYDLVFGNSWPIAIVFVVVLLLLGLIVGVIFSGRSGQLGGWLTGWPWQRRAIPQAAG
jgi:hypothetical protein